MALRPAEPHHDERVVIAARPLTVDERPRIRINVLDRRVAEYPAAEGDRMAAHVHQHPASRPPHVPKQVRERTKAPFKLAHTIDCTERASARPRLRPHVLPHATQ